jgi:putative PIN family toxin of toxin-antitoxin system
MKAVLDVGQYVSATIQAQGHPAQILDAWALDRFELFSSPPILNDLRRVLAYPRIRKRHSWTDEEIELFVNLLAVAVNMTPGTLEIHGVRDDPTDDKILACAREGQVDYIVSSDEHLTGLEVFEGIPIVTPRRFLEILRQAETE